jgi:hypothetical protein
VRHLKPLLLLPLLAACAEPGEEGRSPFDIFSAPPAEEAAPEPLPPTVAAALPPGVPSSVVLQDAAGCYLYSVEVTDPPSGFPLRDLAGNPICEGADGTLLAAGPAVAPAAVTPPAPVAPVTTAPIGSAPLPDESPATAPSTPAVPPSGSITPPAPITPPS